MNPTLYPFFEWLWRASWQSAVLALLVLAAQFCLGRLLDGRWRYYLWLLVVARLMLPVSPPSPASLFNYVRLDASGARRAMPPAPAAMPAIPVLPPPVLAERPVGPRAQASPPASLRLEQPEARQDHSPARSILKTLNWQNWAALGWAVGALALLARTAGQNVCFCRRVRQGRKIESVEMLELFDDCKRLMKAGARARLVESTAVRSPAVYGLLHPRLLLPPGLGSRFSRAELRHIFLHELAHIRRRDLLVQWLVTLLQVLHWFNPVVWLAFRRMAAARELACDELALSVSGERGGRSYGETIIKVLDSSAPPAALPGLVGILEDKTQVFQRIAMIARFRKHSRWSLAGAILVAVLGLVSLTGAQTNRRAELTGHVQLTNGAPAHATVFIYEAGPKVGTSPFCSSCYPDCGKRVTVNGKGDFKISGLDPKLRFVVLVTGEGCQPKFINGVDPAKGALAVNLEPLDLAGIPPERSVRGRIVDTNGTPIEAAAVETAGYRTRDGGGLWGKLEGIDPLAVSDARGNFVITARRDFASLDLKVRARAYAGREFAEVRNGAETHVLQMTEGAALKGRVTLNGKPLGGVMMGVVSVDRTMGRFTGNFEVGTDQQGRFQFFNLPPNVRYYVYGLMDSLKAYGAIGTSTVYAAGDGSMTDAGDLAVGPAYKVTGRVVLSDGGQVPPKTRLLLGRSAAWDSVQVELGQDGSFTVDGVPQEAVDLSVRVPGYHPSVMNASLDQLNPFGLLGRVDHDITGLVLLMEPGKPLESHFDSGANGLNEPENRSLEGAERAAQHLGQRLVSGRVTDAKTGQPIPNFHLTPGRVNQFEELNWNPQLSLDGSNGNYTIYLQREERRPTLKIEAAGYLPAASPTLGSEQTNYDFALTPGTGPSGVVLLPDGTPAAGAAVLLTAPGNGSDPLLELTSGGSFRAFRREQLLAKTDAEGHFSLPPALGMDSVAASAPAGFKIVPVEALKTNAQIRLEPWGTIKGRLLRNGQPSANEDLSLLFAGNFSHLLSLNLSAVTDDKGVFEFDRVPPAACAVAEHVPIGGRSWRYEPLMEVQVLPGKSTNVTMDAGPKRVDEILATAADEARDRGPSKLLHGVVILHDGQPASGAQVGIKYPAQMLQIGDGELVAGPMNENVTHADAQGAFVLPWRASAQALYVADERGFARLVPAEVTNGVKVTLKPWARVEGTLRSNGRAGANQQIELNEEFDGSICPPYMVNQTTGNDGHFLFAHVPEGAYVLVREVHIGKNVTTSSYELRFELKAGESTNLVWGGNGRPVTGKISPNALKAIPANSAVEVSIHTPYPTPPTNNETSVQDDWRAWEQSPAGKAALMAFHSYGTCTSAEGSFQVDDVPPGTYELQAIVHADSTQGGPAPILQSKPLSVQVPAPADPGKREPYDLGNLTLELINFGAASTNMLNAGDLAPGFETRTLDGAPLRLADYQGKFVLLDLRYQLPGMEMAGLRSVSDVYGKDERLVMISLCQSADDDYVKALKNKGAAHWLVGGLDFGALAGSYGLSGAQFPLILLIGPDGKIVARDLRGAGIFSAVSKALAKN